MTRTAAILIVGVNVSTEVVFGGRDIVMNCPKIKLPTASRIRDALRLGSFSLMGDKGLNRGWPAST